MWPISGRFINPYSEYINIACQGRRMSFHTRRRMKQGVVNGGGQMEAAREEHILNVTLQRAARI